MLTKWKSKYQVGEVWENVCGERRCLELFLEDVRQISDRYEFYYHESMTFPALNMLGPKGRRVLILGGGDGGIATYALKYSTVEQVVTVEIDGNVTATAEHYFPYVSSGFKDPRSEIVRGDAIAWIQEQTGKREFDLVVIDFTDTPVE